MYFIGKIMDQQKTGDYNNKKQLKNLLKSLDTGKSWEYTIVNKR